MNASRERLINERQLEMKNMVLYATAKTISVFGTAIYQFALSLYVLKQTGSALSFAFTLILGTVPMLLINPFAGVIADHVNKKVLIVSMDLLNGALFLLTFLFVTLYELNLAIIYILTFLMTVLTTFFGVGMEAAKPNIVTNNRLMTLNSISKMIDSVSTILGPIIGGIAFVLVDLTAFMLINGITFIGSGLLLLLIEFNLRPSAINEQKALNIFRDLKDGAVYVYKRKALVTVFSVLASVNFFLGFALTVPLPYIINEVLMLKAKQFGIIQGFFPIGMIAGALFVNKIIKFISYSALLKGINIGLAVFMIISGLPVLIAADFLTNTVLTILYSAIMFGLGLSIAFIDIPLFYFMQIAVPDEYRGRVMSNGIMIAKTMLPLAMLTSGVLLSLVPAYLIPIAGGVVFLCLQLMITTRVDIDFNVTKQNIPHLN